MAHSFKNLKKNCVFRFVINLNPPKATKKLWILGLFLTTSPPLVLSSSCGRDRSPEASFAAPAWQRSLGRTSSDSPRPGRAKRRVATRSAVSGQRSPKPWKYHAKKSHQLGRSPSTHSNIHPYPNECKNAPKQPWLNGIAQSFRFFTRRWPSLKPPAHPAPRPRHPPHIGLGKGNQWRPKKNCGTRPLEGLLFDGHAL